MTKVGQISTFIFINSPNEKMLPLCINQENKQKRSFFVKFILKFAILAIALSLFVMCFNNGQYITMANPNNYKSIVIFLGVLVLLTIFVKPILKILTLPLNCMTFGLFSLVINFIVVYLADQTISSFAFTSLTYTFLFSITFALMNSALDYFLNDND